MNHLLGVEVGVTIILSVLSHDPPSLPPALRHQIKVAELIETISPLSGRSVGPGRSRLFITSGLIPFRLPF
ncbi:hypothetical protein GOB86_14410, partial [Acetobacter lambici]|uniref:hypothetical protein n=1 Tax=Acetobacter lambici TaxID=1332824 RepID=UPI00140B0E96